MKNQFKSIAIAAMFIVCNIAFAQAASDCDKPVNTEQGAVSGASSGEDGVCAFKGIPYAAPPVGSLRWQAPVQPASRKESFNAVKYGPQCMQAKQELLGDQAEDFRLSEDCLYLNIWRPDTAAGLPVMVFVHGGAFIMGSGSQSTYNGARFAKKENVVIVTINYRLGPFGFLSHPDLEKENQNSTTGNYGILDQIESLKWVRANIAAFGGDPNNVTIFGQSAGGFSICYLLVSPLAKGLFHRAIMESGACETPMTSKEDFPAAAAYADKLGCKKDNVLDCMRKKSAQDVQKAGDKSFMEMLRASGGPFSWWPHVDGYTLVEQPIESLRKGNFNRVPFLLGSTRDELNMFKLVIPKFLLGLPKPLMKALINKLYGKGSWQQIDSLYPVKNYDKPVDAVLAFVCDNFFACPAFEAAKAVSQYQPVFLYRFDYDEHLEKANYGAAHAFELPLVFDRLDSNMFGKLYNEELRKQAAPMVDAIMNYWANFARGANPNGNGLAEWPAFSAGDPKRMILDWPLHVDAVDNIDKCDFHAKKGNVLLHKPKK